MTTVVMIAGLGTVMTAEMPPHVSFAAMGCTTLIVALIADLLVLPAVLILFPGPSVKITLSENEACDGSVSDDPAPDSLVPDGVQLDGVQPDADKKSGDAVHSSLSNTALPASAEDRLQQFKIAEVEREGT